jgi:hypothetical protein
MSSGPVIRRSFPPAPGWSTDGHRSKAPLEDGRGREQTRGYGACGVGDGQAVTLAGPFRNSLGYQQLLAAVEQANPTGEIAVITDNLSSHWRLLHPGVAGQPPASASCSSRSAPAGSTWQEAWWRLFRRAALAGQSFANPRRSPSPPRWRPASSTRVPAPGVGPPSTVATPPAPRPHLPNLRNEALMWSGLSRRLFSWSVAGFCAGEDSARCAWSWTEGFIGEVEEPVPAGVGGLGDRHAAPGHGGSANRHTDVRGSKPQVGYSQEGAPDEACAGVAVAEYWRGSVLPRRCPGAACGWRSPWRRSRR